MELSVARAAQASSLNGSPVFIKPVGEKTEERPKAFVVGDLKKKNTYSRRLSDSL